MIDFATTAQAVFLEFAPKILEAYKAEIDPKRASGTLASTASMSVDVSEGSVSLSINLQKYWEYIERGRRPGKFPPIDEIKKWIQVKGIVPRPMELPSGKSVVPSDNSLAFLIARKIARDGIEPTNALARTVESFKADMILAMKKAYKEAFIVEFKKVLK